jgi:hypothetical protein
MTHASGIPQDTPNTTWYKIKNPMYTQVEGGRELFERLQARR